MTLQFLLLVFNLILILSVIFIEDKNPREAMLWVATLALFPIMGIIFYLIFGSTLGIKLKYYRNNKKLENEYRSYLYRQLEALTKEHIPESNKEEFKVKHMMRFNLNYSEGLITSHNEIKVYTEGVQHFKQLFQDIENATKSIHIQYYSIHNDRVGKALVEQLAKKASQGVSVKVMFDGIGSVTTPNRLFQPLVAAGGKFKRLKPFITHYRNHRKVVVIDGTIGYIGGMNIGEQYVNLAKKKTPWRDTQIRILGEGVYALQYYFLYDWCYANKPEEITFAKEELNALFPDHQITNALPCQFVAGGVNTEKEMIKMSYLKMINMAQKKILLQSPYFVPDSSILDAFRVAAASGVTIELMLPGIKPSFFLQPAADYYISKLLDYGVKVYWYQGYIHAKTLCVDGLVTCIGSVNMDNRSLLVDDEICGFIYEEEFAKEHEAIFEADKKHCIEMDYEAFRNRGILAHIKERFFRLFDPLM